MLSRRAVLSLLFIIMVFRGSFTRSRPYIKFDNKSANSYDRPKNGHNVTVHCEDWNVLRKTAFQCQRGIREVITYGYPWLRYPSQRKSRNDPNITVTTKPLNDALDSLDHVCNIHDRSSRCLMESGIPTYCLGTPIGDNAEIDIQMIFQFICHHRRRDETLVRSLQCLRETRVMAVLYFHIANRCGGFDILDTIMRRDKNEHFYILDIRPYWEMAIVPGQYCLQRSLITSCVRNVVESSCGTMTADFVQNFMIYMQDQYGHDLQSVGLSANICEQDVTFDKAFSRPPISAGYITLDISRLLGSIAPGTALDTVLGRYLLGYLHGLSVEELCNIHNTYAAYGTCVMSADDKSEKSKFNIVQYAHQIFPDEYHGTQCSRLVQFQACWNMLQEICGPQVRGLEQHATLLVEGCKIQSALDATGCHWQDMLLRHYIQASRVTVWPLSFGRSTNPLFLETSKYDSLNSVSDDLETVITRLQPGIREISDKCGPHPANELRVLFNKLRFLQRDALVYRDLLTRTLRRT